MWRWLGLFVCASSSGWAAHLSDGDGFGAAATAETRANTQNIAAIFDFFDDTSLVRVNYSGFLSSPVPGAGPDW